MAFGGPSKSCPRCNSVLPASATFCGTCGYQFSAPSTPAAPPASDYGGPTQYVGPGAQGNYPPSSAPAYAPPGQPGYGAYPPQGQPAYPGYQPAGQPPYPGAYAPPVAAPPQKGGAGKAVILVLVLVVLVGGGAAAWFLYLNPARCSGPLFSRHNEPSSVPMPSGCSFANEHHQTVTNPQNPAQNATVDQWAWTVKGSSIATVKQFYDNNLTSQGWSTPKESTGSNGAVMLISCQGTSQALEVDVADKLQLVDFVTGNTIDTITAPDSSSSALGITIFSSNTPGIIQQFCTGQVPTQ